MLRLQGAPMLLLLRLILHELLQNADEAMCR